MRAQTATLRQTTKSASAYPRDASSIVTFSSPGLALGLALTRPLTHPLAPQPSSRPCLALTPLPPTTRPRSSGQLHPAYREEDLLQLLHPLLRRLIASMAHEGDPSHQPMGIGKNSNQPDAQGSQTIVQAGMQDPSAMSPPQRVKVIRVLMETALEQTAGLDEDLQTGDQPVDSTRSLTQKQTDILENLVDDASLALRTQRSLISHLSDLTIRLAEKVCLQSSDLQTFAQTAIRTALQSFVVSSTAQERDEARLMTLVRAAGLEKEDFSPTPTLGRSPMGKSNVVLDALSGQYQSYVKQGNEWMLAFRTSLESADHRAEADDDMILSRREYVKKAKKRRVARSIEESETDEELRLEEFDAENATIVRQRRDDHSKPVFQPPSPFGKKSKEIFPTHQDKQPAASVWPSASAKTETNIKEAQAERTQKKTENQKSGGDQKRFQRAKAQEIVEELKRGLEEVKQALQLAEDSELPAGEADSGPVESSFKSKRASEPLNKRKRGTKGNQYGNDEPEHGSQDQSNASEPLRDIRRQTKREISGPRWVNAATFEKLVNPPYPKKSQQPPVDETDIPAAAPLSKTGTLWPKQYPEDKAVSSWIIQHRPSLGRRQYGEAAYPLSQDKLTPEQQMAESDAAGMFLEDAGRTDTSEGRRAVLDAWFPAIGSPKLDRRFSGAVFAAKSSLMLGPSPPPDGLIMTRDLDALLKHGAAWRCHSRQAVHKVHNGSAFATMVNPSYRSTCLTCQKTFRKGKDTTEITDFVATMSFRELWTHRESDGKAKKIPRDPLVVFDHQTKADWRRNGQYHAAHWASRARPSAKDLFKKDDDKKEGDAEDVLSESSASDSFLWAL